MYGAYEISAAQKDGDKIAPRAVCWALSLSHLMGIVSLVSICGKAYKRGGSQKSEPEKKSYLSLPSSSAP